MHMQAWPVNRILRSHVRHTSGTHSLHKVNQQVHHPVRHSRGPFRPVSGTGLGLRSNRSRPPTRVTTIRGKPTVPLRVYFSVLGDNANRYERSCVKGRWALSAGTGAGVGEVSEDAEDAKADPLSGGSLLRVAISVGAVTALCKVRSIFP